MPARMPSPWYRRGKNQWYTTMDGKQVPLGVTDPHDEAGAWAALRRLIGEEVTAAVGPKVKAGRLGHLSVLWLAEVKTRIAVGTHRSYGQHVGWLAKAFPGDTAASLDVGKLVAAAAGTTWSDTHRANVLATCRTFLRWCGRAESIPLPPKASRGAECVIPDDVYRRCLVESRGDFHQLIRFLWLTGCRPGEATGLTAADVDWGSGTVPLKAHKTRHRGKTRTLFLAGEAVAVLKEQSAKYGDAGLLFRGLRGKRLGLQAMTMRFQRLSEKVGHAVTSYMFRHTWTTRALKQGIPVAQVATMLGHTSTAMIFKSYSHLTSEAAHLREQADRLNRAG